MVRILYYAAKKNRDMAMRDNIKDKITLIALIANNISALRQIPSHFVDGMR